MLGWISNVSPEVAAHVLCVSESGTTWSLSTLPAPVIIEKPHS